MKQLILGVCLISLLHSAHAGRIVVDIGDQIITFDDTPEGRARAEGLQGWGEAYKERQRLEEVKNEKDFGPLERLATARETRIPAYEDVITYRYADTALLFQLLKEEQWDARWPNIALVIGMVADKPSAKKLAEFIVSSDHIEPGFDWFVRTRKAAMEGLIYATRSQDVPWVMDFLTRHTDPETWKKDFDRPDLSPRRYNALAIATMDTIAQIGSDEAIAILRDVRTKYLEKKPNRVQNAESASESEDKRLRVIDGIIDLAIRSAAYEKTLKQN